jgi:hypothetical protein
MQAFDLRRCPTKSLRRNGAFIIASVWTYQVICWSNYRQGFIDDREKIINEVGRLKELFRFTLLFLKALRNDMVHQALSYSPEVSIYAEELEDVLEDVIVKVGGDAIQPAPECNSIKDLIKQYEEIWV